MEKKILVTVGDNNRIMTFTTPDLSIALDSAPVYNDAAVLARTIGEAFKDVITTCTREGFEFECCPVGGAIEF